jgi:hypothetical protein
MHLRVTSFLALAALFLIGPVTYRPQAADDVTVLRLPEGAMQPEAAVGPDGVLHVVYLRGEPGSADIHYVRSSTPGAPFSKPIRVNSQPGSAIAAGTIRGAQLAIGRNGRVHVVWNGSGTALPKPPAAAGKKPGMLFLYAHTNAAGTGFEPQRNLMTRTANLDGGGSIAADDRGNVYAAWHANAIEDGGTETDRRVWIAVSTGGGAKFSAERAISDPATGVCGCCGMRMVAGTGGMLQILYRAATDRMHRDVYSLTSSDAGLSFTSKRIHPWAIAACPMTSMAIAADRGGLIGAWETDGQVYFGGLRNDEPPSAAPGQPTEKSRRKHPRLAAGRDGTMLLVWTEGMSWGKGGRLAWQGYDAQRRPTPVSGRSDGVVAWSYAAVVARPAGGFSIIY